MDKKFKEIKRRLDTNYKEKYTYDKDGRTIVKMNIKKDGEFLSNFNYEGDNNLSDEAENFFINSTVKLKRDDKIRYEIYYDELSEKEIDIYTKAIRANFISKYYQNKLKLKKMGIISLILAIAGITILTVMVSLMMLNIVDQIIGEVIDIVAWVFLWEAVDLWFLTRGNIKIRSLNYIKIIESDIVFIKNH